MEKLNQFQPYALALLRIVAGYMFLSHGYDKLFVNQVELTSMFGIGGIIEFVGGILLLLGLFTRPAAFLMSGQMAYAYFIMHATADTLFLPLANKGELALLYSVVFFLFVFSGAGALALDNKFGKK